MVWWATQEHLPNVLSPEKGLSLPHTRASLLSLVLTVNFTPTARPASDLHVTPSKMLTEAAPAQACARRGLVSVRKGMPGAGAAPVDT